jgi:hypothetical protein
VNAYPLSEAQRITTTLLSEQAAPPPIKRSAREIANERWGLAGKEKAAPIPEGGWLEFQCFTSLLSLSIRRLLCAYQLLSWQLHA